MLDPTRSPAMCSRLKVGESSQKGWLFVQGSSLSKDQQTKSGGDLSITYGVRSTE